MRSLREPPIAAPLALLPTGAGRGAPPAGAHLEGTELPQGDNHRFPQIMQGATGKRAHSGWDACKLDVTEREKNGECEHSTSQDASAAPGSWDNPGSG